MAREVKESKKVTRAKAKAKTYDKKITASKTAKSEDPKKFCKLCKKHRNHPSYCIQHRKYVGRLETCDDFS